MFFGREGKGEGWTVEPFSVQIPLYRSSQAVSQPEMALNRVTLPSSGEGGGMYRWNRTDLGLPNLLTPHAHIATSCSYIIGEYTPFLKPHTFSLCFC